MTTNSNYVSIEKDADNIITLCFWQDKEKKFLKYFKEYSTMESAKESYEYWSGPLKTIEGI